MAQTLRDLQAKIKTMIHGVDPAKVKIENANDCYKLAVSAATLGRTLNDTDERLWSRELAIAEATDRLIYGVKATLEGDPELMERLEDIIIRQQSRVLEDDAEQLALPAASYKARKPLKKRK